MAAKTCVVCLTDVAGKPRLKDADSRYYCRACYKALVAQGFTRPPSAEELAALHSPPAAAASSASPEPVALSGDA